MPAPQIWLIGKSPECDIVVDRPTVSGQHCRLVKINDQYFLDDLNSTNGTYVNGMTVQQRTPISKTDAILLGSNVPMPWPQETVAVAQSAAPAPPVAPAPRTVQARVRTESGDSLTIGREPENDIVLPFPMVSSTHAKLTRTPQGAVIEDLGSSNGTFLNSPDNRITSAKITGQDILFFGSMRVPAARLFSQRQQVGSQSQNNISFTGEEMTIGRDPSCDQVLEYPMISQRHAKIIRKPQGTFVQDLGSANGTFVNGRRINRPTLISPGDAIGLGSYEFRLTDQGTFEKRDYRGNVTIEASKVSIEVPGKKLLNDISLTIYPTEFVGLMGPSGAGKTTLMNALNGYTRPTSGTVSFNGRDLYENYAQFAHHLGYVPQDDIIHRDLTVGQALYYTAKLRLPPDTSETEINERIEKVISQLGLEGTENVLIGSPEKKGISGGQRKRVNLAQELLTDPSVLFLDEPTSGLSSEDALMVMKVLRDLANSGKAILLTIHQPSLEAYRLMDNLVLVGKDQNSPDPGQLVYYGPAYPDAVNFFNPNGVPDQKPGTEPSPDEVLRGFAREKSAHWSNKYQQSPYYKNFVTDRTGKTAPSNDGKQRLADVPRVAGGHQWATLVKRYLTIKSKDFWNTTILLAQAPFIAFLVVMVFGKDVSVEVTDNNWSDIARRLPMTIFLTGLSALWFGCSNAVREIVGEWAIYHRERMVNLKIPSYVFSKLAVLGGLCVVQCLTLLGIVSYGCNLQGNFLIAFVLLLLVASVGIAIGLLLSSVAKTSEVAIALLPIILLPMVILGGVMQPIHNMNPMMGTMAQFTPSRWGFETMMLAEAYERPNAPEVIPDGSFKPLADEAEPDETDMAEEHFPRDERFDVLTGSIVLVTMFLIAIVAIHMVLRVRDVH